MSVNTDIAASSNLGEYNELAYGLERGLNEVENFLSTASAFPVVGIFTSILKAPVIGVIQIKAGIIFGLISIIPVVINKDYTYTKIALNQVSHGLGNICAFIFEFFPGVGSVFYYYRMSRVPNIKNYDVCIITGHENKFMPYMSLVNADWRIDGSNKEAVKAVKQMYAKKVEANGGLFKLSLMQKMELAREAINEYSNRH